MMPFSSRYQFNSVKLKGGWLKVPAAPCTLEDDIMMCLEDVMIWKELFEVAVTRLYFQTWWAHARREQSRVTRTADAEHPVKRGVGFAAGPVHGQHKVTPGQRTGLIHESGTR
jgi:hypothetical protein